MTPRKELFVVIKEALKTIKAIEMIDLNRNQFDTIDGNHPGCFTAALISSPNINYGTMVERKKEGDANIEVLLFVKDGWLNQHQTTEDDNSGFNEIDLIDTVTEALELLQGDSFKPLELIEEGENDISEKTLMSYKLVFNTTVYKKVKAKYKKKKLTLS